MLGDKRAISEEAIAGYKLFESKGCVACHNGLNIGGGMFQKFGIFDEKSIKRGDDLGLYSITKRDEDKYVFRVPSLRNVAKSAPYLHDGSVQTLKEVIRLMIKHQIGEKVDEKADVILIPFFAL